jgi:hypothetical protein
MGFVGFVISTFSFAMVMMGWGGAAGLSGILGVFFFVEELGGQGNIGTSLMKRREGSFNVV